MTRRYLYGWYYWRARRMAWMEALGYSRYEIARRWEVTMDTVRIILGTLRGMA